MKSWYKRGIGLLLVSALCLTLAVSLTGCAQSDEGKYKHAQSLLTQGAYAQAAAQFEEISSYEDAAKCAVYCRAWEAYEQGEISDAIATFEYLGDFKDCAMVIQYLWGMRYEAAGDYEKAIEAFGKNPFYKDSKAHIKACQELWEKEKEEARKKGVNHFFCVIPERGSTANKTVEKSEDLPVRLVCILADVTIQSEGDPRHGLYPNGRKRTTGFRAISRISPHSLLFVWVPQYRNPCWEGGLRQNGFLLSGKTGFAGKRTSMRMWETDACQQPSGHYTSASLLRR